MVEKVSEAVFFREEKKKNVIDIWEPFRFYRGEFSKKDDELVAILLKSMKPSATKKKIEAELTSGNKLNLKFRAFKWDVNIRGSNSDKPREEEKVEEVEEEKEGDKKPEGEGENKIENQPEEKPEEKIDEPETKEEQNEEK